jgi:[acyl-carrier-protein] S-malonyltransferase
VILAKTLENFKPEMVAGHSLENSLHWVNGALSLRRIKLVSKSIGNAKACEIKPSTMAAVLDWLTKSLKICASIDGIVVAANYNCPGQLVISGEYKAVELA